MIVASLLLVIVAAVTLVIGLFNPEEAMWVWASIACCVVAGLLLIAGVMRSRPKRKPVLQSGGEQPASWAGAQSWATIDPATGAVVDRESVATSDPGEGVRVVDEPPATQPAPAQEAPAAAADPAQWAPEPAAQEATPAAPMPTASDADMATGEIPPPVPSEPAPAAPAAKSTTRKATGAVAAGSQSDEERINTALKGIQGVGPAKRQALIAEFPTYRKLRAASVDKLAAVPGVSKALAERIHTALHS